MKVGTQQRKTEAILLDQGTEQLLNEVKRRLLEKDGKVNYRKLRLEGHSERFLKRLYSACPSL